MIEHEKSDQLEKIVVVPIEKTPRPKRPDTAKSHKEVFEFSQIKKHPNKRYEEE